MLTQKTEKNRTIYECLKCDFISYDKKDYARHLKTIKHKQVGILTVILTDTDKKTEKTAYHICECGKEYKHKQSLYTHKKKCNYMDNVSVSNELQAQTKNELTETLKNNELMVKLFHDMKDMFIESQKQITSLIPLMGTNTTNNNNTTNNTTNNLNINIFLNEKCKDAMSMNQFIESIDISLQDLIKTKEEGFASGISNIFLKGISKLSPYQRPIHCTDVKRETLYIKNDKWEKDANKEQLKEAIKNVSAKQFKNIKKYKEANPNCMENDKQREEYLNIIKNTTETYDGNSDKIIKNICNAVYVKDTPMYNKLDA
jgi:hypothetical protein